MPKFIAGLLIGIIAGGAMVFFLFGGVPRAGQAPGVPIRPPDPAGMPAGTAQIVLRQDLFNEVVGHIMSDMAAPSFPMGGGSDPQNPAGPGPQACDGPITLLPEGSGVKSAVSFADNKISAPLAFSGNYNSPFGCLRFTGWAQANFELRFDAGQQAVFGRINVETVNLDGVNPLLSGFVTPIVQSSINTRVNPIQILKGSQIAIDMPIAASGGQLRATVKDVRAEVRDGALNLYVIYDFAGEPNAQPTQ
jgi:hypothetical protein